MQSCEVETVDLEAAHATRRVTVPDGGTVYDGTELYLRCLLLHSLPSRPHAVLIPADATASMVYWPLLDDRLRVCVVPAAIVPPQATPAIASVLLEERTMELE